MLWVRGRFGVMMNASSATRRLTFSHVPCIKLHSSSIKEAYYMLCTPFAAVTASMYYIYIYLFLLMGESNFLFLLRVSSKRDRKASLFSK